jgi:hypothetical protein
VIYKPVKLQCGMLKFFRWATRHVDEDTECTIYRVQCGDDNGLPLPPHRHTTEHCGQRQNR